MKGLLKRSTVKALVMIMGAFFTFAHSATDYPDSLVVQVTYFDYHSDGSNPDFNPGDSNSSVITGLVRDTLNKDGNPVSTKDMYYSQDISRWFEPWENRGEIPVYGSGGSYVNYMKSVEDDDTSYINMVIEDSLTLELTDPENGTYSFSNTAFFPLDNRGFGNEKTKNYAGAPTEYVYDHNYSFTMKLEHDFVYRKGLKFSFKGDDDVWVFINGKLALDLGGCHPAEEGEFSLDQNVEKFGLTLDKKAKISFFFAERQADGSNCMITTNILSAPPNNFNIEAKDTIQVGDTAGLAAIIKTDTGDLQELNGSIEWGIIDPTNQNPSSTLKKVDDLSAEFVSIKAHTTVKVWGKFKDNEEGLTFYDTTEITVLPGELHHIVIEDSYRKPEDGSPALWNDTPLDGVIIYENDVRVENFHVIARDVYNNWIGPVESIRSDMWSTEDSYVATAENGNDSLDGEGAAVRGDSPKGGDTRIRVTLNDSTWDDIHVMVTPMFRIEVFPYPSPAVADREIDSDFELLSGLEGMVFLFEMIGTVGDFVQPEILRAEIVDETGNLVAAPEMKYDEILYTNSVDYTSSSDKNSKVRGIAALHWDCTNSSGRVVSNGSYVASIYYKDNVGIEQVKRVMLGIQKQ